jgi:hypothetical protein
MGIAWLSGFGIVSSVFYVLGPIGAAIAFLAAGKALGTASLEDPFVTAVALTRLPFAAVALAAGILEGDAERHLKRLGERLARDPQSAGLYLERGTFLAGLGRSGQALADFDMALKLRPNMRAAQKAKENIQDWSAGAEPKVAMPSGAVKALDDAAAERIVIPAQKTPGSRAMLFGMILGAIVISFPLIYTVLRNRVTAAGGFEVREQTEASGTAIDSRYDIYNRSKCEENCRNSANCKIYTYDQSRSSCYLYTTAKLISRSGLISGMRR